MGKRVPGPPHRRLRKPLGGLTLGLLFIHESLLLKEVQSWPAMSAARFPNSSSSRARGKAGSLARFHFFPAFALRRGDLLGLKSPLRLACRGATIDSVSREFAGRA